MSGVLVLDSAYRPKEYIPLREAVERILKDKVVSFPGAQIIATFRSPSTTVEIPAILVLKMYFEIPKALSAKISMSLLKARDNNTCQYCGRHTNQLKKHEKMTKEHVKPKCLFKNRKDADTWENMVLACSTCNHKKGDKLPYQCGMRPLKTPVRPKGVVITIYNNTMTKEQKAFVDMYYNKTAVQF